MKEIVESAIEQGRILGYQGRFKDSFQYVRQAYDAEPNNPVTNAWMAIALMRLHDHDECRKYADRALQLGVNCAFAHVAKALIHQEIDYDLKKALFEYNRAIALSPNLPDIFYFRAGCFLKQKDTANARQDYDRVLKYDPLFFKALLNLAYLHRDLNEKNKALEYAKRAVEVAPSAVTYIALGEIYTAIGDRQSALWAVKQSFEYPLDDDHFLGRLAYVYEASGEIQSALDAYTQMVELCPYTAEAIDFLYNFEKKTGIVEKGILNKARRYLKGQKPRHWWFNNADDKYWHDAVYWFYQKTTQQLNTSGERFVEYWECSLAWGRKITQTTYHGSSSYVHQGRFGVGYLLFTDKNVRITSVGVLSKRLIKDRGIAQKAFFAMLKNIDNTGVEQFDKMWIIPYSDILQATLAEGKILLQTPSETWEVTSHYAGQDSDILATFNMGRSGKLTNFWMQPAYEKGIETPSMIIETLEKLAKLRDSGVITEIEFETKKTELLERLTNQ